MHPTTPPAPARWPTSGWLMPTARVCSPPQAGEGGPAVLWDGQLPPVWSQEAAGTHRGQTLHQGVLPILSSQQQPSTTTIMTTTKMESFPLPLYKVNTRHRLRSTVNFFELFLLLCYPLVFFFFDFPSLYAAWNVVSWHWICCRFLVLFSSLPQLPLDFNTRAYAHFFTETQRDKCSASSESQFGRLLSKRLLNIPPRNANVSSDLRQIMGSKGFLPAIMLKKTHKKTLNGINLSYLFDRMEMYFACRYKEYFLVSRRL